MLLFLTQRRIPKSVICVEKLSVIGIPYPDSAVVRATSEYISIRRTELQIKHGLSMPCLCHKLNFSLFDIEDLNSPIHESQDYPLAVAFELPHGVYSSATYLDDLLRFLRSYIPKPQSSYFLRGSYEVSTLVISPLDAVYSH